MSSRIGRRQLLQGAGALGAALPQAPGTRLNVLHVISDQHQAGCASYEGHPQAITPNMDRLAKEGVRFSRAYTQNPICLPSRVSILSGQYPHNHGFYGLGGPPPQLPSFLGHFRRNGYRTAAIGKVHVPQDPENWLALDCDFWGECYRYYDDPPWHSALYENYLRQHGVFEKEDSVALPEFPGDQQHEGRPSLIPYEHSVEGWSVSQAIQFMDASGQRPFCLQVSLPRPHQCYTPDRRFWEMYRDDLALPGTLRQSAAHRPPHFQNMVERLKNMKWLIEPKTFEEGCRRVWHGYLGAITQVDFALGQMLDYLDRTGKASNTIVIYHADHGAYSGTYGVPEKAPGICSDAVCRVPMIWRVPGVAKAGILSRQFAENIDIAPTITALCGLAAMETTNGADLSGILRGDDRPVREVAVTENVWSKALRWGPWRFVHYPRDMFGSDVGELYNLEDDPNETRNLYESQPGVVQECRRLLMEWLIRTTRFVGAHPPPPGAKHFVERIVGDGKESNLVGVSERVKRHAWNYI